MEPKISVIVPVYNAEKYIEKCVASLTQQTLTEIEIILVDDGSKDNSSGLCDKLAEKDKRIRVIHKANGGASSARNAGLKLAIGKYIAFLDGDDVVDCELLQIAYDALLDTEADCAKFGVIEEYITADGSIVKQHICKMRYKLCEGEKAICNEAINMEQLPLFGYLCNGVYKRSIIAENRLALDEKLRVNEDFAFNLEYFKYVKKMVCLDIAPYHYARRNAGSLSSQNSNYHYENHMLKIRGFLAMMERCYTVTQENLEKVFWMYTRFVFSAVSNGDSFENIKKDDLFQQFLGINFAGISIKKKILVGLLRTKSNFLVESFAQMTMFIRNALPVLFAAIKR